MLSEQTFCCLLFLAVVLLYLNTVPAGFVWDDRAAIINNGDVTNNGNIFRLFSHDFWGQDITLPDSHKSYRPVAVLSFRLNYMLHGLSSSGFHGLNVLIYGLVCVLVYLLSYQWLSPAGARVASLLFCFHPIHVEAVASLVGRADSLCGLFFCACCIAYTATVRQSKNDSGITMKLYLLSVCLAIVCSLTKEIGVTVFGVFCVIEVIEVMKNKKKLKTESGLTAEFKEFIDSLFASISSPGSRYRLLGNLLLVGLTALHRMLLNGEKSLYNWTVLENHVHLEPLLLTRTLSYGQMHFWYIFKLFYPRYLSFDYGYACVPVIYSLLDIRNIFSLLVWSGMIAAIVYSLLTVRKTTLFGLAMLLLPLVPASNILFPVGTLLADRLLFIPSIGFCILIAEIITVELAEYWQELILMTTTQFYNSCRFVCRSGFALADLLELTSKHKLRLALSDVENWLHEAGLEDEDWNDNANHRRTAAVNGSKKLSIKVNTDVGSNTPITNINSSVPSKDSKVSSNRFIRYLQSLPAPYLCSLFLVLPLCALGALTVVARNNDWHTEMSIFRSALSVCPLSVKALSNFGHLSLSNGNAENAVIATETASVLYSRHVAALINGGLAHQRLGNYAKSVELLDEAISVDPNNAKVFGYRGSVYYGWSNEEYHKDEATVQILKQLASESLDEAIRKGFEAPSILHARGSVAMEQGQYSIAVHYLSHALQSSKLSRQMARQAGKSAAEILNADGVNEPFTYNQLGSALHLLGRDEEALIAYQEGIRNDDSLDALYVNMGNLLRVMKRFDEAKEVMKRGLNGCQKRRIEVPLAYFNNLGLIELDNNNPAAALELFLLAQTQQQKQQENGKHRLTHGVMKSSEGNSVEDVVEGNINRARHLLLLQQHQQEQH